MPTPDDPRLGLPSASSALEQSLCHGRFRAQRDYAELTQETAEDSDLGEEAEEVAAESKGTDMDRDADAGKRIHLLYAGQECNEASSAEADRAAHARLVDEEMYAQWLNLFPETPVVPIVELREQRFWLKDGDGNKIYSGQADLVWIRGNRGEPCDLLVADLKGLWGYHDPAKINQQLRHYIALIAANIEEMGYSRIKSVFAYLNQPAKSERPEAVRYDPDDIETAIMDMMVEVAAISDPDAPRTPGPLQCRLCRAKLICEEYQTQQGALLKQLTDVSRDKGELMERIAMLPPDRLSQLLSWAGSLKNAADLAIAEGKRRLRIDSACLPGWRLKNNAPRESITDVGKVYAYLAERYGLAPEEFAKMVTITKKEVAAVVRKKSGLKGKALAFAEFEAMDGACTKNPTAASIEPIK